jgi:sugar/nucleoside kinase (ribokinase family)
MGEIDDDTFSAARSAPFVGLTPQGLLRAADPVTGELDPHGHYPAPWVDRVDAVVLSESEAERLAAPADLRRTRSAVTRGERGCLGRWGDRAVEVRGIPVDAEAVATIGAGDVFATAYFIALAGGMSFPDALAEANRTAAAHVARPR